jgi:hypothetical protein
MWPAADLHHGQAPTPVMAGLDPAIPTRTVLAIVQSHWMAAFKFGHGTVGST